ncbi:MAG: uracil-DNA glycosylase family protein [Nodosilinea sp.]
MADDLFSLLPNHGSDPEARAAVYESIPTSSQVAIAPGTYGNLDSLSQHCRVCQRCDLAAGRTHVVVSRGNRTAPILIIGEGPGQQEDEQGLPFVGKSGQLLDQILAAVSLNPEQDVYICNIVKCRPPGNRVPTPKEISACNGYLLEQIRLVNPKIILLTGATAVKGILGFKEGISQLRGKWFEWQGYLCMPIFHPAYLLRNQSRTPGSPKWLMWQDIQAIKAKLEELLPSP